MKTTPLKCSRAPRRPKKKKKKKKKEKKQKIDISEIGEKKRERTKCKIVFWLPSQTGCQKCSIAGGCEEGKRGWAGEDRTHKWVEDRKTAVASGRGTPRTLPALI